MLAPHAEATDRAARAGRSPLRFLIRETAMLVLKHLATITALLALAEEARRQQQTSAAPAAPAAAER